MSERKTIRVEVFNCEQYDGKWPNEAPYTDGSLLSFSAWLAGIIESIPPEFRANARFEIGSVSSWEDSHYANIEVSYNRPETDDEMKTRLHHEKEQARAKAQHQERQERELLAALTAKYKA